MDRRINKENLKKKNKNKENLVHYLFFGFREKVRDLGMVIDTFETQ